MSDLHLELSRNTFKVPIFEERKMQKLHVIDQANDKSKHKQLKNLLFAINLLSYHMAVFSYSSAICLACLVS